MACEKRPPLLSPQAQYGHVGKAYDSDLASECALCAAGCCAVLITGSGARPSKAAS